MTTVRVRNEGSWEVVASVPAVYGDAAGVARRLRSEGVSARVRKGEVIVDAGVPILPICPAHFCKRPCARCANEVRSSIDGKRRT